MQQPDSAAPAGAQPTGDQVIATIATGRRGEELRVAFSQYKGRRFLAVRIWYEADDETWKPSGKGINVKAELLPQLAAALAKAEAAAAAQ